jgi:hypothetical protein
MEFWTKWKVRLQTNMPMHSTNRIMQKIRFAVQYLLLRKAELIAQLDSLKVVVSMYAYPSISSSTQVALR